MEKAEGEVAEEIMGWWETLIEQLRLEELMKMDESMKKLHRKMCDHINRSKKSTGENPN